MLYAAGNGREVGAQGRQHTEAGISQELSCMPMDGCRVEKTPAGTVADRDDSKWNGGDARGRFRVALDKKSPVRRLLRSAIEMEQDWP